jgi:transposase InsO family protein
VQFEGAPAKRLERDAVGRDQVTVVGQVWPPSRQRPDELHAGHLAQRFAQLVGHADDRVLDHLPCDAPRGHGRLAAGGVRISMDGTGRYLDNIFIERLWRSLKYEDIYIKAYASVPEARRGHRRLVDLLQRRASASGTGLSNSVRRLPGAGNLWICGQRQRVDHIPTGPSSAARKGFNRIGKGAIVSLPPRTGRRI